MQTELSPDISPGEAFQLLVSDDVIEHIVIETNRYATQSIASENLSKKRPKKYRLVQWKDTTIDKMKTFLGLLLWMDLVKYVSIEDYWLTSPLLLNQVAPKVMSRNRFQLLLTCMHFNDNIALECEDRLMKIRQLLDKLQLNFQVRYVPGEFSFYCYSICVVS